MAIRSDEITSIIRGELKGFEAGADVAGVGTIVEVGDGIAQIYGLSGALASELLEFPNGIMGMAFNLEEETVGALILGDYTSLKEGDQVKTTGTVSLGNSTLNIVLGFTPAMGDAFTLIDNDGADGVSGTFNGLAESATFGLGGMTFQITYHGGSGNDVVVTRVA